MSEGGLATQVAADNPADAEKTRVSYLLGAGATHACASLLGGHRNLLMRGLREPLAERLREYVRSEFPGHAGVRDLANAIGDEGTDIDIEQVITFLDDAPSGTYRKFAQGLRLVFWEVLQRELDSVRDEEPDRHSYLYAVLTDMHLLDDFDEHLNGFMTLNYDLFLEHAISTILGRAVDYGVETHPRPAAECIRVLKLHGSFGWSHDWPITATLTHREGLWIPPGIRKVKSDYPFNAIWGLAREMLDCDVLRVIGCNLSENDWDLISMLFSTRHTRVGRAPYDIEIIDKPNSAEVIKARFPYLEAKSLLEIPRIGEQLVSEALGVAPERYAVLPMQQQRSARENASSKIGNPFELWLKLKAEDIALSLPSFQSDKGVFNGFVDSNL